MRCLSLALGFLLLVGLRFPAHATGSEADSLPPLVLRMGEVTVKNGAMPSTGGHAAKTAREAFWLSVTALLTFGVPLLDLPNVVERGEKDSRSVQLCLEDWKAVLEGPKSSLKSPEFNDFVMRTIAAETASLLETRAGPVVVRIASSSVTQPGNADALNAIASELSTHSLVLGDVSIDVEPSSLGCVARLQANASLQLVEVGTEARDYSGQNSRSLSAVSSTEVADVHGWASEPEVGRRALRLALLQLAEAIVKTYPWPAGQETKAPASAPDSGTR